MAERQTLTKESLAKYEAELEHLKVVTRKEIAKKIREAREQGDLAENAEYDVAKDEQRDVESRIEELENIISNAEILDESSIDYTKIHIGCKVTVTDKLSKKDVVFNIVDKSEINSLTNRISYDSPIGKALMNKSVGDLVDVAIPSGTLKYKVKRIG
ncbi:MAG: transcription elongation factor GreA [Lachnospiraceae bacterium]|jgi:transcription elongation factor GreA